MQRWTGALFLFFILIQSSRVFSQAGTELRRQVVLFEGLSLEQGLSQGMINHIMQDKAGFMWFATKDGLNRFDGYTFQVYRHQVKDSLSLSNNYVTRIFEDSRGFLWIGTNGSGLDLFDRKTETFSHFQSQNGKTGGLKNLTIQSIAEDKWGRIWIGTNKGLYTLDIRKKKEGKTYNLPSVQYDFSIRHIQLDPKHPDTEWFTKRPEADYELQNIHLDQLGRLWVSSFGRFFRIQPQKNENHPIEELDPRTYLWFDREDKGMERHAHAWVEDTLHKKLYTLSAFSVSETNLRTGGVRILHKGRFFFGDIGDQATVDRDGFIWFAESGRILKINISSGESFQIVPQNETPAHTSFYPNRLFLDRGGVLWVGSRGLGLWKYNVRASRFHFHPIGSVQWMQAYQDSLVAMVTSENQIHIFNSRKDQIVQTFSGAKDEVPGFSYGIISSLLPEKDGSLWITKSRLLHFRPKQGKLQEYRDKNQMYFPLFRDRSGAVWMGTDQALCQIRTAPLRLEPIPFPFPVLNWPYTFVQCMLEDKAGFFWLGTAEGLLKLNPKTRQWKVFKNQARDPQSLSVNLIFCISPDPRQPERYLWIGTNGGGLNRLDISTGKFRRYNQEEGLPNNVVYGIQADKAGFLWISTNAGLCRMDPVNGTFKNFRKADGLQGDEFNRYAHCKDGQGYLFFGGINGFNYFDPESITDNSQVPAVVLTDIRVMNKSLDFRSENARLKAPPFLTTEIELLPEDKVLSLDFSALDYAAPGKNQFRYKLDGFDKSYVDGGTRPSVTYTNLDPGSYTFHVLGSNPDGVWGKRPLSIRIRVQPPWYQTWWFRFLAAGFICLALYSFYLFRLRQALRLQALRNHIAQDLHDEIGSNLSNISIFSDLALAKPQLQPEVEKLLGKIQDYAQLSQESMSDIVWMVNARNDKFEEVLVRMRSLAAEWCESKGIHLELDFSGQAQHIGLSMEQRKNFWLLFKESLNNAIKYSQADRLFLQVKVQADQIYFQLSDNGIGFDPAQIRRGNGLGNIGNRAKVLGGRFTLNSQPGKGTSVELWFPV